MVELVEEVAALKQMVAAQRDEIARLKGLKGRPKIKPNGMEKGTDPKRPGKGGKNRRRGKVTPRLAPAIEVLRVDHPPGSQFRGYEPYDVQDLVISTRAVHDRRERWLTPSGETIVARLPSGIRGHFGPQLRGFVLFPCHQGQVTVERLVTLLQAIGVTISKRQVDATADRPAGRLRGGDRRGSTGRIGDRDVDHGGRHRRPPPGGKRPLHADWQ